MNTTTNQSHGSYRTNNVGNNNMYILKIPILTRLDDGGCNYIKETMSINLDHLVYAYPTKIKVTRIKNKDKGGWERYDDESRVNELMLTRRNGGGPIYTTVDIPSSIDWILHSGPGFYDLTK